MEAIHVSTKRFIFEILQEYKGTGIIISPVAIYFSVVMR